MRYFAEVKAILDQAISSYCNTFGISQADADKSIAQHIKKTGAEHYKLDPDIDYDEPLCRLGYLFSHAGANAYLCEKAIAKSKALTAKVCASAGAALTVCTVGGGPGTEVLGVAKFLGDRAVYPSQVRFTVLDAVQEWYDSWTPLATRAEAWLQAKLGSSIPIAPGFYQMDVASKASYDKLAFLFGTFDVVIFNYLLSENKVAFASFPPVLAAMAVRAATGCHFLFIDRFEKSSPFRTDVRNAISASGLKLLDEFTIGGCMDDDGHAESDLGDYPARFDRRPRRWFRNPTTKQHEVFVLVAAKP